jgi:hypothetical protein
MITLVLPGIASANTAADMTIIDKTAAVEKILYGVEQTGSLIERVNKLEQEIFGVETKESLAGRTDRAYSYATETKPGAPSLIFKLNTIEWHLTRMVTDQPAKTKLEVLERTLYGNSPTGPVDERLNKLLKLSLETGWPDVADSIIPKDTLVKIKLTSDLNSKSTKVGETVSFQVENDVLIGGVLVIPAGAQGYGRVTKVEQRKNFGRDAKLEVAFETVVGLDGSSIATEMGDKAKEETKSLAKAAGATAAGLVLLGPVGVVGGAFIQGQDIAIPAGTELYIQIKADTPVSGIKVN